MITVDRKYSTKPCFFATYRLKLVASSQPKLGAFLGAFSERGTPMALTDISIKNAKPRERDYKLADGGGLYLLITVSGGKL
jgi:hypothetical protein